MSETPKIPDWKNARSMDQPHFAFWMSSLTSEGLHAKADIARLLAMLTQALSAAESALAESRQLSDVAVPLTYELQARAEAAESALAEANRRAADERTRKNSLLANADRLLEQSFNEITALQSQLAAAQRDAGRILAAMEAANERGVITDTLWMLEGNETVFDAITALSATNAADQGDTGNMGKM